MADERRLESLDALRGFDMFWIIGGSTVLAAWADSTGWPILRWMSEQCEHVPWHGFHFWDLIFPLFLFIAGVAMPFSLTRRVERGDDRARLHRHVVRRGLALVLLGVVYNGLLSFDFESLRVASVLGRIGLGYMLAALVVLNTSVRGQALWTVAILLGYWAALSWIPVPELGAGDLSPGKTLADHVDRLLLPGRLYHGDRDPEGLLSTVPAVATALIGALTGHAIRHTRVEGTRRSVALVGAGVVALGIGWAWDAVFPINKNLWTSSFVVWTAGWSLILLGVFHQLVDVWRLGRWLFPFTVIGMNPLLIYVAQRFVDFDGVAALLLARADGRLHVVVLAAGGLALKWLVLLILFKRGVFLRV